MSEGRTRRSLVAAALVALLAGMLLVADAATSGGSSPVGPETRTPAAAPAPRQSGYFRTRPVGAWSSLPSGRRCAQRVRASSWEPRPDNARPNHRMPDAGRVHAALALRPVAQGGHAYRKRWDSWLLQRVDGHYTGTTDEILQWAGCKWGIADNVMRAIAVQESTWYAYEVYPSGRCVEQWGCGDTVDAATSATRTYCRAISRAGHDYEADYGPGVCPKTFGLTGVMSWEDPAWGRMPGNQNGTFPFNRDSTAFAADYLGAQLRGCLEGWELWLGHTGSRDYRPGRLWGCIGAWYAGDWLSSDARWYIRSVRHQLADRPWLEPAWATVGPPCSPTFGCPRGN
jgi:hypothetical protein